MPLGITLLFSRAPACSLNSGSTHFAAHIGC
jgi:hypothetical protein